MKDYENLPCKDDDGNIHVVVETPKGSAAKIAFDPKYGVFLFKRPLDLGVGYPFDWGFVPSTKAEDGDPLDAMVLFDAPTWPGVVVPSTPIGVVRMTQKEKGESKRVRNDRIVAVPASDRRYKHAHDLPQRVRDELEQFFVTSTQMLPKRVEIDGWGGPNAAMKVIERAALRYISGKGQKGG